MIAGILLLTGFASLLDIAVFRVEAWPRRWQSPAHARTVDA